MQFTYDEFCGENILEIKDDVYNYLIKARRHKIDDEIYFRNLKDENLYLYKIILIDKKKAILNLLNSEKKILINNKSLHIGWCVIDPKTVEKYIASLNEIGVDRISFIYSDYSQKNFKINIEKLEKILINSSCQCGRSDIIKLDIYKNLNEFISKNQDIYFLDFSKTSIDEKKDEIKTIVVGCEGGFSNNERDKFDKDFIVGFNSNLILRSETAVLSACSKIIL
ncbi:16S rRNA (uracil(1498)-N(3))-methyltransferase [Arcobacter aquimarinus]|uniref:Ribosomal RNA small subunit methyltransferase E n=1 Tax=Arcobacter aquimarinus TaxID=1315211 RepID=A0AAE7B5D1_9BACT|nr:16S rRNA (uracil(1498)-N(3))-methyltransferase [Arcobacter aquimarinus]QKE26916.1 16S rRNA m3U1498 methyltransferase [Arcobacter aquimarinus]RXI36082.1 16S rRNA (uracil(1498)-N(3))-methyltransferase [Arcobacter aquimarinus]